jgi:acyl carrier protein
MTVLVEARPTIDAVRSQAADRRRLCLQVKELLVRRLDPSLRAEMIADDQPLFGRGLELDSIDTLELAVAIQDEFEVVLTDDNVEAMLSVNRLVDHVAGGLAGRGDS